MLTDAVTNDRRSVMSQVTQPKVSLPPLVRPRRIVWLGALLALAVGAALMLIVALGHDTADNTVPAGAQAQPSLRSDGGPEETAVAAAVGSRPAVGPNEAQVAASIAGAAPEASSGPDESPTAAAVGGTSSESASAPDESGIAASISGR